MARKYVVLFGLLAHERVESGRRLPRNFGNDSFPCRSDYSVMGSKFGVR